MAYVSTSNRPFLMTPGPIASGNSTSLASFGGKLWGYVSTDPLATVIGSSYFSDGFSQIGLRKWDSILHTDINSTIVSLVTVTTVTTGTGGVTCSSLLTS